ncbi:hypothetical protein BN946_scf184701.g3 [Trametes cinnabarina]|uniref:Fungal-type protein kinase domain-containing protein n=1 Tax=Pycnoporus cinnabarinus TaxID=5643 RepID=A0A060SUY9_PYCCI|nr:hypothetical protein BN946_scf184701.g3 [Trametes cinnabarina]
MTKLISTFPAAKKLDIVDTHSDEMACPFRAFESQCTKPDISLSFPGELVSRRDWRTISMVVAAKSDETQDPFTKDDNEEEHVATVVQLANNARNLLIAHGFLSAFVVGVYGRTLRLARFDHAFAIVSAPISLVDDGAHLLKKFLWHFVHPLVGHRVVGSDPTLMPFSTEDRKWVKGQLARLKPRNWEAHVGELEKGRRVEVYDQRTGKSVPYLLYHLVDVNGQLFSRATMVWRAIEDTRIWQDGQLVPDPNCSRQVKPRILKEAWRQLVRTAETEFYDRLESRIPHDEMFGLARMECGGDIGALEARWWKRTLNGTLPDATDSVDSGLQLTGSSPPFCSIGQRSVSANHFVAPTSNHVPPFAFPLPYPQQQTYSQRLHGPKCFHSERSHMRIVIKDVGHPLTEFIASREMVAALRDAIEGHQTAWENARILHRDVHIGNILIADDQSEGSHRGFLHDFDCSSMEPFGSHTQSSTSSVVVDDEAVSAQDVAKFKERTGTRNFIALELLNPLKPILHQPYHDLESFYWVLLWVVLRHTNCRHQDALLEGQPLFEILFRTNGDALARSLKVAWLYSMDSLVVMDNIPLTTLITKLTHLIVKCRTFLWDPPAKHRYTHVDVLAIFDEALAMDGWPETDWKPCTLPPGQDYISLGPNLADIRPGCAIQVQSRDVRSKTAAHNSQTDTIPTSGAIPSDNFSGSLTQPWSGTKRRSEDDAPVPSGATQSRKRSKTTKMGPPPDPTAAPAGLSRATRSRGEGRRSGTRAVPALTRQPTRWSSRIQAQKEKNASRSHLA